MPEHHRLRQGTPQHPEAAEGIDTSSTWLGKFKLHRHLLSVLALPVLIKVGIIITHMLGFGSGTFYLCPLEEEGVSLRKWVSTSVRLGQTLTLEGGPEKESSAAGFAACKPVEYTVRFFRQPLPPHSCLILIPIEQGKDAGVSQPQSTQQCFPSSGAAGLTLIQQNPPRHPNEHKKSFILPVSAIPCAGGPFPAKSLAKHHHLAQISPKSQGSGCAPLPPARL